MESAREKIVIVGGGFSGAMTAFHLLNQKKKPLHITIIEPKKTLGLGLAYSTTCGEHLLNVSAAGMSALADDSTHFLEYARAQRGVVEPEEFLPRLFFGQYVNHLIERAINENQKNGYHTFERIEDQVCDIEFTAPLFKIETTRARNDKAVVADHVVLALGNLSGKSPRWLDKLPLDAEQYLHNPWDKQAIAAIDKAASVLIIGTGLTAVDKIVELKTSGHTGHIVALSRHGLLPRHHLDKPDLAPAQSSLDTIEESALGALKKIRKTTAEASHWQSGIDTYRSVTQAWWRNLSKNEKLKFMRHLQTYWDVHRHRMAPSIAARIDAYQNEGQLAVIAGGIREMRLEGENVKVSIKKRRASDIQDHTFARVINCTGPQSKLNAVESDLLASLLNRRLIKADITGAGLCCTKDGHVISADDVPNMRLHALGPMLKAELLESVAVPELKHQARMTAQKIIEADH
jgi:uncharacterized NAD(P)/FAD-binding protein YdhS